MPRDYIRDNNGILVMDGAFGSTYIVETVESIDANLDSMRARPDHPDIDRLLDARQIVAALRTFVPAKSEAPPA